MSTFFPFDDRGIYREYLRESGSITVKVWAESHPQRFTILESSDSVERELSTFFPSEERGIYSGWRTEKSPDSRIRRRQCARGRFVARAWKYKRARLFSHWCGVLIICFFLPFSAYFFVGSSWMDVLAFVNSDRASSWASFGVAHTFI